MSAFGKYTPSFIVNVGDRSISVTSPKEKVKIASVIIINDTLDKIVSELRSNDRVLKRFVLRPQGKEVFQVSFESVNKIYYVPIAPPFESVELKFSQRSYEVPEKK